MRRRVPFALHGFDLLTLGYVTISIVVLLVGRGRVPGSGLRLLLHAAVAGGILLLGFVPAPRRGFAAFLRASYPLFLLGWFYAQTAGLSRAFTSGYHDARVQRWDLALFGTHLNVHLAAWLPWPLLSEILHGCYFGYELLVPALGITLWVRGRRESFRAVATTVLLTFYVCYLTYIFFPVRGPWYEMPHPEIQSFGVFPPLVWWMLARGAAVGAAFPSSHVAVGVVVAILAGRFSRRLAYVLVPIAAGIPIATVYGGFHYAIDALVGFGVGVAFGLLGPRLSALRPAASS